MQLSSDHTPPKLEVEGIQSEVNSEENDTGSWENFSDSEAAQGQSTSPAGSSSTSPAMKRSHVGHDVVHTAPANKPNTERAPIVSKEEVQEVFIHGARFTARYSRDVVKSSIGYMRRPLSWFVFLWMFTLLVPYLSVMLRNAFSPFCFIPGISRSALCTLVPPVQPMPLVDFPRLMKAQESAFGQIMAESMGGSQLSIEVLKAEMATKDLSVLVRHSELKSRDILADRLYIFASNAKKTARGLTKLNAKVAGAVDEVMSLNNYAMVTIESAHQKATSPLLQAIMPFKRGRSEDEIILDVFTLAMDKSEEVISRIILEAEISRQNLEHMDAELSSLHDIIIREDKDTNADMEKLLGDLWTKLGGRRDEMRGYDKRLALLSDLGNYRKKALAHVTAALQTLHSLGDDLEVLRERVATPGLVGGKIPLQLHIDSIQNGLDRLKEGIIRAREVGEVTVKKLLDTDTD